jgi:RNA 3'-terminal phosphate cyclase (ATP)
MNDVIHIDGSHGEGGGQIIRSSLALSLVTGRPVTIDNIRAGREKPGLMRQHLTAANAAVEISGALVTGAAVGSRTLMFEPGPVRSGEYQFRVGTAGSATLVLQTILPALLLADGPSTLILEGGTHNPWAPPFDFLQQAYLPLVNRMGPHVELELERAGFFPAGGGRIRAHVQPARSLGGFNLGERGEIVSRQARVLLSDLPDQIARRELQTIRQQLGWDDGDCTIEHVQSAGPGNALLISVASEHVAEVFSGFGRKGVKAEQVAGDVVKEVRAYMRAGVPVGPHLADQLMLPLGISAWLEPQEPRLQAAEGSMPSDGSIPRGGSYRTQALTGHSTTHIELLRKFLGVAIDVAKSPDGNCTVHIAPSRHS